MFDTNILKVLEPYKVICVSWKFLDEAECHVKALPDYRGYKAGVLDDKHLISEIWDVLDKADIVIAHHGDSFDIKMLNARFLANGYNAPSAYKTIDTRKVAKKYFRFASNSLNELAQYLGEGRKASTGGFDLWDGCINGDLSQWAKMKKYNIQDVKLLERVYLRLRPFMQDHPNLNVIANPNGIDEHDTSCPACLGHNVQRRGFAITRTGRKQRFQCNDCGVWSSGPYEKAQIVLR
jgi:DNA polymerase elongation subunit (family B)